MPTHQSTSNDTPFLLGTNNPDKQDALRSLLEDLQFQPTTPAQLGLGAAPDETGDTHEQIARSKATYWSRAASMLAIASDGGLVLPALGSGWESRYTHRFAGQDATNLDRLEHLLELMQPYSGPQREASWVEAVAIADRGRVLASWEIKGATGLIANSASSRSQASGFWAFSVWYFPQLGKTYDQLTLEEREEVEDHWVLLRRVVQSFFLGDMGLVQ